MHEFTLDGQADLETVLSANPQWETFPIKPLVDDVHLSLAPQLAAQDIDVAIDVPAELTLAADRNMVRQAALNIVLNSLDSMPDGGQLVITAHAGAGSVDLEIADSGAGLTNDSRRRMFEPFFTTKRGGTGLGLAIVDHIAQIHGGRVSALNCPEGGAAFTLHFPRRTPAEAQADPQQAAAVVRRDREHPGVSRRN
jgi:signal transduction histidine kinase